MNPEENTEGQELFSDMVDNENVAQINLARRLFGNESELDDTGKMLKWVEKGYAIRFRSYLDGRPDIRRKLMEGDGSVLDEIEKAIATLH